MGDDTDRRRERGPGSRIPEELFEEILFYLPTKSLYRFGCVSKSWSTIIARRRTLLPMSALFFENYPKGCYFAPITNDGVEDCKKVESCLRRFSESKLRDICNGLLLFFDGCQYGYSYYSVRNPKTMESVDIPPLRCPDNSDAFVVYDPFVSPHYKVLLFTYEGGEDSTSFKMYSSVTEKWVKGRLRGVSVTISVSNHVYLNGALYYLNFADSSVWRLDVETMQCEEIILPNCPLDPFLACIGVSRGHVCYAAIEIDEIGVEVWTLEEKGDVRTWLSKHSTDGQTFVQHLKACGYSDVKDSRNIWPLTFQSDSEVVYVRILDKVFSYHPDDGERLVEICNVTGSSYTPDNTRIFYSTFTITPSLESICHLGSTIIRPNILESAITRSAWWFGCLKRLGTRMYGR